KQELQVKLEDIKDEVQINIEEVEGSSRSEIPWFEREETDYSQIEARAYYEALEKLLDEEDFCKALSATTHDVYVIAFGLKPSNHIAENRESDPPLRIIWTLTNLLEGIHSIILL
ncbi:1897_t:CDS:2, partial [Ambispora leptoticha]